MTQSDADALTLPEGKSDAIYFDDDFPGLGLRLRTGDKRPTKLRRSWIFQYQLGRKQRRMTLGTFPAVTLAKARRTASELHASVHRGEDPAAARDQRRRQAGDTVEAMLKPYLAEKGPKLAPRTRPEIERHLLRYAKPLHGLSVASITRRDISALTTDLAASAGHATANNVRSSLATFLNWCITQGLIEENPVRGSYRADDEERTRALPVSELVAVWRALDQVKICDGAYRDIVRLLILTGQRREEIGGLRFDEIRDDLDRIELPPPRTKPKRAHTIPLSDPARAILRPWIERASDSPFVFGARPYVSWSLGKRLLDEALATAGVVIELWVIHDLRRSVATGLADQIGTWPPVIEAVLNHSGHKADIALGIDPKLRQTYVRAEYENQKRIALVAWADHIMAAIEDRPTTVVALAPMRA
jgi:integrase